MSAVPITRDNIYQRIAAISDPIRRAAAAEEARRLLLYHRLVKGQKGRRKIEERRKYAGRPGAYFTDILGWFLTPQQDTALELIEANDRVLIPSANNVGKTFLIAGYGAYRFDAVAALYDEELRLDQQGARLLLAGPDHNTIFDNLYSEILRHAAAAEARGFPMPGRRSPNSVLWKVRPLWDVVAFSPPRSTEKNVAHTASGRHHRNQIALIEEGQGADEPVWRGIEGMCSAAGNKIISPFNPTEPSGPAYNRARAGTYKVLHLSAFDHPNVRRRMVVVPGAIAHSVVDARVREDCRDRGPAGDTVPDVDLRDFVYAVPARGQEDGGTRADGELGAENAELRVYRPGPIFQAQVMGQWPNNLETGLFTPQAWDMAVDRWLARVRPSKPPDRVGVDAAREGGDETCACPAWGDGAESLLIAYAEAQTEAPFSTEEGIIKPVDALLATRRIYVGEILTAQRGDGPFVAEQLVTMFPRSPFVIDEGGPGVSVLDHMLRVMGVDAQGVSFAASPPDPTPGEEWSENMRTAMYVRAARLVRFGLVDVPDDPLLREEIMAHEIIHKARTVDVGFSKERKPSLLLIPKDEIKKRLHPQRSPDRADAFVLALTDLWAPHIY